MAIFSRSPFFLVHPVCKYFWPTNVGDNEVGRGATNVVKVDSIFWVEVLAGCDRLEGDDVPGHEDGAEEVAEDEEENYGQESVDMVLQQLEQRMK